MKRKMLLLVALCRVTALCAMERDNIFDTALIEVARQKNTLRIVPLLLLGANPTIGDEHQATALHYLVDHEEFPKLLPFFFGRVTAQLDDPAPKAQAHALQKFLDSQDCDGQTPLHWAAHCGSLVSWQKLLLYGAQLIVPDHQGNTPLYALDDTTLQDWEFFDDKKDEFFQFLATPIGSIAQIELLAPDAAKCIFSFLCGLHRLKKVHNICLPNDMIHKILFDYLPGELQVAPLWSYYRQFALEKLINKTSFRLQRLFVKNGKIAEHTLVHVLLARHNSLLEFIRLYEKEEGNHIFAHKLAQLLAFCGFQKTCSHNYLELLRNAAHK